MQTNPAAIASQYRREAEHFRHAVEMIEDERLREQLLGFAREYEAAADSIERELRFWTIGTPAGP